MEKQVSKRSQLRHPSQNVSRAPGLKRSMKKIKSVPRLGISNEEVLITYIDAEKRLKGLLRLANKHANPIGLNTVLTKIPKDKNKSIA